MTDDFDLLNNFIHDLKNPLSSVKSYIELIEHSGDLNDRQKHFSERALVGVERIERIVLELLDFARMESETGLHMATCDLRELVHDVQNMLEHLAEKNRVSLSVDIPGRAQFVHGEGRLLRHVFSNLMSNSIKYNVPNGEVRVLADEYNDEFVEVLVEDTGIGMPADDIDRIFERFYRIDRGDRRKIEGTGIGLSIVRMVIERHGGEIWVDSEPDKGSTFRFTLPRRPASAPDSEREIMDDIDDHQQEDHEDHDDSDADIF